MQHAIRCAFALFLVTASSGAGFAKAPAKEAEYKRSDANYYWKGDVLKVDPTAVIIPAGDYIQKGDSYFIPGHKKDTKEVYVQVLNDWIEPITPPDMPASLGVAPDAMQIREPQGDVQVALPAAPATFTQATDGMTIPNGAIVKTGADGTAAVLFGGVNSARLVPNSEAAVQQTITPQSRSTEVDLRAGAVFSKVGQRIGEKQDYEVHTPFGVAAARGTDFVSVAMPARTDVWIAQGTVQLKQIDGTPVGTVSSEGTGGLKIIRYPVMTDPHQAMTASSETMTMAMNFIPMANKKVEALRAQMAQGVKLTDRQKDYLSRIKKVPCLIKLALVEPPPAPPAPAAPAPAVTPPVPAPAVKLTPMNIHLRGQDTIELQGETKALTLDDLKSKLEVIAKATPQQTFVIQTEKQVPQEAIQRVLEVCAVNNLKATVAKRHLVTIPPPPAPPATPAVPVDATTTPAPVPATTAPAPLIKASPVMTPRTDETASTTSSASTTPPKKKKSKKTESSSDQGSEAPIATGPNDTVP